MAQVKMAEYYASGQYAKQNIPLAIDLLNKAAKQGNARALFKLGVFSVEGIGTQKDSAEDVKWLSKAAKNGDSEAIKMLRQ